MKDSQRNRASSSPQEPTAYLGRQRFSHGIGYMSVSDCGIDQDGYKGIALYADIPSEYLSQSPANQEAHKRH